MSGVLKTNRHREAALRTVSVSGSAKRGPMAGRRVPACSIVSVSLMKLLTQSKVRSSRSDLQRRRVPLIRGHGIGLAGPLGVEVYKQPNQCRAYLVRSYQPSTKGGTKQSAISCATVGVFLAFASFVGADYHNAPTVIVVGVRSSSKGIMLRTCAISTRIAARVHTTHLYTVSLSRMSLRLWLMFSTTGRV